MQATPTQGFIYLVTANIIFMVAGYGAHIFIARYLGPKEYGIYGIIITVLSIVNLFLTNGIPQSVSKYVAANPKNSNAIIRQGGKLQLLLALIVWIVYFSLAGIISGLLGDPELVPFFRISSLIIPFYAVCSLYIGYFNGLHFFKTQAALTVAYSVAKLIGVIALAAVFEIHGAIIGFALSPIVALFFISQANLEDSAQSPPFDYKKLLRFASLLILFNLSFMLLINLDLLMVKSLLKSNTVVAYYTAAVIVGRLPYYLLNPLAGVLFPSISRSNAMNDLARVKMLINQSLRFMLMLSIPGVFLIAATSRNLVTLLYSSRYIPAAEPMVILAFGVGFMLLFFILSYILNGGGAEKIPMTLSLVGLLLSFFLNLSLITRYGLKGAATATCIVSFLLMLIAAFFVYKRFRRLVSPISVTKIVVASLVICCLALVINVRPIFLPIEYIILFVIYFGLLWMLKEIKKDDLSLIKELIPFRAS